MGEVGKFAILGDPQGAFVSVYQPEGEGDVAEGVFVWDELGTNDVDGAEVLRRGLRLDGEGHGEDFGGYKTFEVGERSAACTPSRTRPAPRWIPYVGVEDADATVAKASELGGSTAVEAMDIPTVGRFALIKDPQGAVFGVIKPGPAGLLRAAASGAGHR